MARRGRARRDKAWQGKDNFKTKKMKELLKQNFSKGDYITPEQIENELGQVPSDFQLMAICQAFNDANSGVTIKVEQGGIRFLTDSEASNYNHNYFGRHISALFRNHKKMLSVDQRNLSKDEVVQHKRRIDVQASFIVGIKDAARSLLPVKSYDSGIKKLF